MGATMNLNWFLDACAIIYLIEASGEKGKTVKKIVTQRLKNSGTLSISRLSFLECRIMPLKKHPSFIAGSFYA